MAITPPESGDTIHTSQIEGMDASVLASLNAMTPEMLQRFSLSAKHGPSLFVGGGVERVTANVTCNTAPSPFSEATAAISADWQDPPEYQVAGADLPDCVLVIWVTLHLKGFASGGASSLDSQAWVNLYYDRNGAEQIDATNSRPLWTQVDDLQAVDMRECVTICNAYVFQAGTLDLMGIKIAENVGGASPAPATWTIDNGAIGWFALRAFDAS
jgi:hypothetical protein